MSDYLNLEKEYNEISALFSDEREKQEFQNYTLSAVLKIWGTVGMFAPEYLEAINRTMKKNTTPSQILTGMFCCSDKNRKLRIPEFFKKVVEDDLKNNSCKSRMLIDELAKLFVGFACINGDFTIEEANEVNLIMLQLRSYCDNYCVKFYRNTYECNSLVTPQNESGYWLSNKNEKTIDEAKIESDEKQMPASDENVVQISLNLDDIYDSINEQTEIENKTVLKNGTQEKSLEDLLAELDSLVGLEKVKRDVHSLLNFIKICKLRESRGFVVPPVSYHLVFTGNPGTGKTTVARLVASIYYKMGLLSKGQLVEADRSILVAGYIGQTAIKVQSVIKEAIGGVLFIDEAYSLVNDEQDSFGREAIETLLKAMEDHRDELVVIVAGYENLMKKFIESNPGLRSRFNKYFFFPDYETDELADIFNLFCKSNGYKTDESAKETLISKFTSLYSTREEHFGNARAVRNIFETAIGCQANRLSEYSEISDDDLALLTNEDVLNAFGGIENE